MVQFLPCNSTYFHKMRIHFTLVLKIVFIFIFSSLLICIYISLTPIKIDYMKSRHKLSVIVPFRNRFEEMLVFVPHLHHFLTRQKIDFSIYIINQVDSLRFNRASLINVGYLLTKNDSNYFAIHDIDLLPLNDNLNYGYPQNGPFHISSPNLHPLYHYSSFIGGIILLKNEDFEKVNGLSNKYWGWGLEDDEFYLRLKEANLVIGRPINITTGIDDTFLHIHGKTHKRDVIRILNQKQAMRKRDRQTGLNDVKFELVSRNELIVGDSPCTVFTVKLFCDYNLTPWCDFSLVEKKNKKHK